MGVSRRQFTKEFKLAAVRRLEQGVSMSEAARALEVSPNVLHRWRREFRQGPGNAFPGNGKDRWSEGRIAELERKIGQQSLEIDFLKGCLQRIEEQRMLQVLMTLFKARFRRGDLPHSYAVAHDGRFLVRTTVDLQPSPALLLLRPNRR